jgi:signal transduction histidine kinase
MTTAARMNLGVEEQALRLAFLDFTADDAARLRELHSFALHHVGEIVEAFYDHLLKFDAARAILRDDETIRRLKHKQRDYFLSLTSGDYGQAYFEGRLQVGDIHQQINLAPQWYLGTYSLYIRLLLPRLFAAFGHAPERLNAYLSSLHKVMFLDMGLAIDAYISGGYMNRTLAEQFHEMADRATTALAARDAEASAKQTLVDMMVHDICNPVSGIRMTAQVALRHADEMSEAQVPRLQRIERSAADVLRMVENILAISKLESGMLVVQMEDFSVDEALRESVEQARPHIEAAQVSVILNAPPPPLRVRADWTLTRRILQNLLSNAIRHSHARQIRLTAVPHDDRVLVGVADQGAGIPRTHHELIFERFRHFDRGTPAHTDTGLGLPFCKMAVEQMGGIIWVDSSEGQGATFYFTLPRSEAKSAES